MIYVVISLRRLTGQYDRKQKITIEYNDTPLAIHKKHK
jgi:hypothetical protein